MLAKYFSLQLYSYSVKNLIEMYVDLFPYFQSYDHLIYPSFDNLNFQ